MASSGILPTVSFIIPAYNAERTLRAALVSALEQTYPGPIELSVFDDCSTDGTAGVVAGIPGLDDAARWPGPRTLLFTQGVDLGCDRPQGPAFGRNRAVEASSGRYLCCLDADDLALPCRVEAQLAVARAEPDDAVLIGGGFTRDPPGSTATYTAWANSLSDAALVEQQWRECTLIQPTWFLARSWWERLGGWDEESPWAAAAAAPGEPILSRPPARIPAERWRGQASRAPVFPEDTLLFHRHLFAGGRLRRVPEPVTVYVYSATSQTWSTPRALLLATRARLFEERVLSLPAWQSFTIWGSGRDGKAFFNALSPQAQARVAAFADIDPNKIGLRYPPRKRRPPVPRGGAPPPGPGLTAGAAVAGEKRGRDSGGGSERGGAGDAAEEGAPPAVSGGGEASTGPVEPTAPLLPAPASPAAPAPAATVAAPPGEPPSAPIVHFSAAAPPIVCCVAMHIDTGADDLQRNVQRLGVVEGEDFWYFC